MVVGKGFTYCLMYTYRQRANCNLPFRRAESLANEVDVRSPMSSTESMFND